MTSSVQFGLRKRQKVDVSPQAFSEESDEESNPQLSEGDVNAQVNQLQVNRLKVFRTIHINGDQRHWQTSVTWLNRHVCRRKAAGMLRMGNILLRSEHGIKRYQ